MLLGKKISFYAIETINFYYYFLNFLLNTIFINSLVVGPGLKVCEEQSTLSRDDLMNWRSIWLLQELMKQVGTLTLE